MSDQNEKKQGSSLTLFKVVRAVLIGAAIFWLLGNWPRIMHAVAPGTRPIPMGMDAAEGAEWLASEDAKAKWQEGLPPKVKQGDYTGAKSTAQCHEEVNTYWHAVVQREVDKGDTAAAEGYTRREWADDSGNCSFYDSKRINAALVEPLKRLDLYKTYARPPKSATAEELAQIAADVQVLASHPDSIYALHYYDRLDALRAERGEPPVPRPERPLPATCGELQASMVAMRDAEEAFVRAFKRFNSEQEAGPAWKALIIRRMANGERFTRHAEAARIKQCVFPIGPLSAQNGRA